MPDVAKVLVVDDDPVTRTCLVASGERLRQLEAKAGGDDLAGCRSAEEGLAALLARELDEVETCVQAEKPITAKPGHSEIV